MQIICIPEFDWRIISYDTHKLLAVYLGIRPWKKIVGKKKNNYNVVKYRWCYIIWHTFLVILERHWEPTKKLGNEKPRIALNLLLMTNFVWSFAIDFMPEETKW